MNRPAFALFLLTSVLGVAAVSGDYLSAERKFQSIENGQLRAGSRVHLSAAELNAYVAHQVPTVTGGVRQPRLRLLTPGLAEGTAFINFAEVGRSQGHPPGWLMSQLLDGEHPVRVTARIQSAAGQATVKLQSVEISGVKIQGETLDFMIKHFLLPLYPNAAVDRPFDLGDRIERLDVQPTGVNVLIGR